MASGSTRRPATWTRANLRPKAAPARRSKKPPITSGKRYPMEIVQVDESVRSVP
jgi:hypothetical protein